MDEDAVVVWWLLQWLSQVLTPGLIGGALLALLLVGTVVLLTAGVVFLRYRRHPRVQRAILRLRAERAASDPQAHVIDLRLHLSEEMEVARRAVASIDGVGAAGDLPALLQQLEQTANRLDRYLRALERSVDDGASYRSLAPARQRVADVVAAARDIRRAAIATLDATTTGEIQALTRTVEQEVAWVQSAVEAMSELDRPDPIGARPGPSIDDPSHPRKRPRRT